MENSGKKRFSLLMLISATFLQVLLAQPTAWAKPAKNKAKAKAPAAVHAEPPAATVTPSAKITPTPTGSAKNTNKGPVDSKVFDKGQYKDEPTLITSDSLALDSQTHIFRYSGNVKVVRGDMTLTSDELEGIYNEQNKIEKLIAKKNVKIVKGENMTATGGRAEYVANPEIITLTESPEIQQNDSALTADTIKLFMETNRSEALGQVRVKVANVQDSSKVLGK